MSVQLPVAHDAVAFGNEHGMSQPPQSVRVVVDVPWSFAQSAQPRQLSRVPSCVSQPSCSAEQSAKPAEHPVNSQEPLRHAALPFGTKQELSHRPQ